MRMRDQAPSLLQATSARQPLPPCAALNRLACLPLLAACRAKALAEWQAWAIAGQQQRWRLVTICPGNTYGPLLAASPNCGGCGGTAPSMQVGCVPALTVNSSFLPPLSLMVAAADGV